MKNVYIIHHLARMTSPSTDVDRFGLFAPRRLRLGRGGGKPLGEVGGVLFDESGEVSVLSGGGEVLSAAKTEIIQFKEKKGYVL